jgi:hypothetical protein
MKKALLLAASMMIGAFAVSVQAADPAPVMKTADCMSLSPAEQQFASQLNMSNKDIFCGKFNSAQRSKAMQMMGQPDASGAAMSADAAVQKVQQEMPAQPKTSGGGCPVK